jgi:aspartate oxidase
MLASSGKSAVKRSGIQSLFEKSRPGWITHQSVFPSPLATATDRLKETMWNQVGIVRNQGSLTEALMLLDQWEYLKTAPIVSQAEGEFKNMVTVASMIVRAALLRENSVGAHYRSDDPEAGKSPDLRHIAFRLSNQPQGDWT